MRYMKIPLSNSSDLLNKKQDTLKISQHKEDTAHLWKAVTFWMEALSGV